MFLPIAVEEGLKMGQTGDHMVGPDLHDFWFEGDTVHRLQGVVPWRGKVSMIS